MTLLSKKKRKTNIFICRFLLTLHIVTSCTKCILYSDNDRNPDNGMVRGRGRKRRYTDKRHKWNSAVSCKRCNYVVQCPENAANHFMLEFHGPLEILVPGVVSTPSRSLTLPRIYYLALYIHNVYIHTLSALSLIACGYMARRTNVLTSFGELNAQIDGVPGSDNVLCTYMYYCKHCGQ